MSVFDNDEIQATVSEVNDDMDWSGSIFDKPIWKLTIKAGVSYGAPWLVSEALSTNEISELAKEADKSKLVADFLVGMATYATEQAVSKGLTAPVDTSKPQASGGSSGGGSSQPSQQSAPGGETRTCAHGQMVFKSGVSKSSGKPWKAFMCPAPQGSDQCKPQFLR